MTSQPNQLVINLDDVSTLAQEGGKLMYTPMAEDAIIGLLTLKDEVEKAIDNVKEQIAAAGQLLDPNFKGVIGERVKSVYRTYGEKYAYDGNFNTPNEVLKTVTTVKVNGPAIDKYIKENGKLPEGISEKGRTPILSLTRIDYESEPKRLE